MMWQMTQKKKKDEVAGHRGEKRAAVLQRLQIKPLSHCLEPQEELFWCGGEK